MKPCAYCGREGSCAVCDCDESYDDDYEDDYYEDDYDYEDDDD